VKGPNVVFPSPTQSFVEKDGSRKFRATELNPDMGIYIKVTADYEEGGKKFTTGEELFITGREQQIYYPRPEHAIIRYGDRELHYGVTIPEGEARYVLNKDKGSIDLVCGPLIFLPDPRKQVIVRRVLESREVVLFYPGNDYALEYNEKLLEVVRGQSGKGGTYATDVDARKAMPVTRHVEAAAAEFQRGTRHTPPRTITLDTKYEGAVAVGVWEGFAVKITNKSGASRVVVGPRTELLAYDETLAVLALSKGKPKTTDNVERTVYLRVSQNQVSDIVDVVTRDMVKATIRLSYRVNFEGKPENWFRVENYVKFLCDHARSVLRHTAKQQGIEALANDYVQIVRNAILGDKPEGGGPRRGMTFEENGLRVYDVEVLGIEIGDTQIATLLQQAQLTSVKSALKVAEAERELAAEMRLDEIAAKRKQLEMEKAKRELEALLKRLADEAVAAEKREEEAAKTRKRRADQSAAELAIDKAEADQTAEIAKAQMEQRIQELQAEAAALKERMAAISPDFVASLQAFGSQIVATEAAKAMGPLAILGGESVADVLSKMLKGTALEGAVSEALRGRTAAMLNGGSGRD
jgi:major vault protein